jgi:hypothetical protein
VVNALGSHVGSSARTDSASSTRDSRSRKENKKFEYPPARNSPAFKAMAPNVTRGPTSFIWMLKSPQSTIRRAPLGATICDPQHVNSNSPSVVNSLAASSNRINFENSN